MNFYFDEPFLAGLNLYNSFEFDGTSLYHYTSMENLTSIMNENGIAFYATNVKDLDDKKEFVHIYSLFDLVISKLAGKNEISTDYYEQLKTITPKNTSLIMRKNPTDSDMVMAKEEKTDMFITCFSTNSNSKYLWDQYSKKDNSNGGCIQLDVRQLSHELSENYGYSHRLLKVIYDDDLKNSILRDLVIGYKEYNDAIEMICDYLNDYAPLFKDEEFSKEEEVRLIYDLPREQSIFKINENKAHRQYIERTFTKSIAIGSVAIECANDSKVVKDINDVLSKNGYSPLEIREID